MELRRRFLLWFSVGYGYTIAHTPLAGSQPTIDRPFALTDMSGKPVTDRDFRGRWLLVVFGYTSCPDVCPTILGDIAAAMAMIKPLSQRVLPLFITVDPERDTPAVLRDYLSSFDAGILGLTGSREQVASVARTFGVSYYKDTDRASGYYTIAHSAIMHVIGPEGGLVARIGANADPKRIADTLRPLVR